MVVDCQISNVGADCRADFVRVVSAVCAYADGGLRGHYKRVYDGSNQRATFLRESGVDQMTMPSWTFDEVWTQMLNVLQNDVVAGLVLAAVALSFAGRLISFLRRSTS